MSFILTILIYLPFFLIFIKNNLLNHYTMNKDVKKIISEAFNELYNEIISEAPKVATNTKVGDILNKIRKYGAIGAFKDYGPQALDRDTFNYIVNEVIKEYKATDDEELKSKLKGAIQGAFYPGPDSKMLNTIKSRRWGNKNSEELQNAAAAAFEDRIMNNFDGQVNVYNPDGGGSFGGIVLNNLERGIADWFTKGYRGKGMGGGMKDAFGSQSGISYDIDDDEKNLSKTLSTGGGSIEGGFSGDKEILNIFLGWLKNNGSKKQYIAFKEMTNGNSPHDVAEMYPEIFKDNKDVSTAFGSLMKNTKTKTNDEGEKVKYNLADEFAEMIKHAKGINWNPRNIIAKKLRQTVAINPEFTGTGKVSKVSTPEIKDAKKYLNDLINSLGPDVLKKLNIKNANDFNSDIKINKIANKLTVLGMGDAANEIKGAQDAIKSAQSNAENFGAKTQFVDEDPKGKLDAFMSKHGVDPSEYANFEVRGTGVLDKIADAHGISEKDKKIMLNLAKDVSRYTFGGMMEDIKAFDGFDMNVLMERIKNKIS